ncbi:HK97-gp10 family putative phage morphogenesis protein [Variovorax saccharolyticus]|uniref:HK97-gp10 family putative phage morphogenesis protein n=1 Tax=Variovorax saccharolyticus TaxID=3053516 RepID=UPI002578ACCB|nr:HK97-gp10 family putative phage morphogenesis protein [Variovorax sp. J31P216]MDM0024078.1 HK97 gp10 family phage protein [Variovorax sp. J31P216]
MADTQTLKGLDDVMAKLRALPPEIASKRGGPVKAALRKGAVVIQKEAQSNIRKVTQDTEASGYVSTKTLEKAIVVRRDPNPQRSGANERYRVMISRKKYEGRDTKAVATGRYLEFGTEHQKAEPWMTPAFMSTKERALLTIVDELSKGIDRAIAKVSKGAR